MKRLFILLFVITISVGSFATGQDGDVIYINGEKWELLGKPIEQNQQLYQSLKDALPYSRPILRSNWDAYTAYWSIRGKKLYLDSIMVSYEKKREVRFLPVETNKVFKDYCKRKNILATWYTGDLRVAKGEILYDEKECYIRNYEHEQYLSIRKGKLAARKQIENKIVINGIVYPTSLKNEINEKMPFNFQSYSDLEDAVCVDFAIGDLRVDSLGNLIDCEVTARSFHGKRLDGIALEMKEKLKKMGPWKTLLINGEFVPQYKGSSFVTFEIDPEDRIFSDPYEEGPAFRGGNEACREWIGEHLIYPEDCIKDKIEGSVKVSFWINRDGTLDEVEAIRSPHPSLSKEAVRIVKQMPKWKPRKVGNKTVRSRIYVPVDFELTQALKSL